MDEPLVSIITVCYNSEETIASTVESVLGQTYKRIEYIIVDGASEDRTVEIAESYRDAFEKKGYLFRVVSEKDDGIYDALNKGTQLATGTLVGQINSTDLYKPICVTRAVQVYNKTNFDVFYADLEIQVGDGSVIIKRGKPLCYVTSRYWNHPTTFFARRVFNLFQYKTDHIFDDWDLIVRLHRAGMKFVILNEVLATFFFGGVSNEGGIRKLKERIGLKYRVYRDNGYSPLYWFECAGIECVKFIMQRFGVWRKKLVHRVRASREARKET